MRTHKVVFFFFSTLLAFATANAQDGFFINGSAIAFDSCYQLTSEQNDLAGSIWNGEKINLNTDFEIAMKSTNDVSKHHPQNFQSKVITALNEQYDLKNKAYNLNLTMENA